MMGRTQIIKVYESLVSEFSLIVSCSIPARLYHKG